MALGYFAPCPPNSGPVGKYILSAHQVVALAGTEDTLTNHDKGDVTVVESYLETLKVIAAFLN